MTFTLSAMVTRRTPFHGWLPSNSGSPHRSRAQGTVFLILLFGSLPLLIMAKPWDKVPTGVHKGNWQEELVLERETGVRFYPDPTDRSTSLLTNSRCIIHSEREHPKDYKSAQHRTYTDLKLHKDYISSDGKGPRQRLIEDRLKQQVVDEVQKKKDDDYAEKFQPRYATENTSHYTRGGFSTTEIGARTKRFPTHHANYATDEAITFYTHAVKTTGDANFPCTAMPSGQNIFAKNAAFSTDIRNPYPRCAETHERPLHPSRVNQFRVLQDLRQRMVEHVAPSVSSIPGSAVRRIVAVLDYIGQADPVVSFDAFVAGIDDHLVFQFSPAERKAIEVEFDADCRGVLSCAEFLLLIRPTMTPRRLELVDIAFRICDSQGVGAASKEDISNCLNVVCTLDFFPDGISSEEFETMFYDSMFGTGNATIGFDDFIEFFNNMATEFGDDEEKFESIIRAMFNY
jgi:hypothetical protein